MATATFVDETTSGVRGGSRWLDIAEERLSVGELIRRRAFQEVAEFNARTEHEVFQGLVQPEDTERVLTAAEPSSARATPRAGRSRASRPPSAPHTLTS
jgi:hypothetical protein